MQIWLEAVRSDKESLYEHRIRRRDGKYVWMRTHGVPIFDASGASRERIGITTNIEREKTAPVKGPGRLTGAQIRAARGILKWSAEELAEAARTTRATIRRFEESDGPLASEPALRAVEEAMTAAGVEFLYFEVGKPAVRLR